MKLGVGTAQFGMNYGIANRSGQPSRSEVSAILELAGTNGVDLIDTANLYGESELVIGECLPEGHRFNIVTKTPYFPASSIADSDRSTLRSACCDSLRKLRQASLYALLVHNADDLLKPGGERLYEEMQLLKDEGLV